VQRVLVAQLRDGVAGRLLSIELSGDAPATLARQSTLLAERIGGDALFRYVANGSAGFGEREIAVLEHHRYVLSDRVAPSRFEVPALRDALETRLEELAGSAGPIVKQSLASDPTAETREVLRRIAPGTGPGRLHGVWFDPTRTRALLVAETRASGAELDAQQSAIDSLQRAFAAVAAGTSARIRYSSAGAIAAQSRTLIAEQAARITVVSAILIVAILAWAYRSFAAVLLCGVPAVIGWLAGVVAVDLAFGGVHGITLAFGATLLGEAVDYPSFLLTQARRGESLFATRQRIGRWLWLAVLTTACGSVALVLSGFRGLMQLGMLTIVGIGVAGVVTWHGVPQWISPGWSARPRDPARALRVPTSAPTGVRMLMVAIAVFVALASTWHRPVWDDDPARLNPLPAELIVRDRELRDELGGPDARMLVLVRGASLQDVLQRCERLRGML
jgi:predicted exporter